MSCDYDVWKHLYEVKTIMNSVWRWAWVEVVVSYNETTQKDQNLKHGLTTQI